MAGNLITSLLSLATNLLPSITASPQTPSSSSNPNDNSEKGRALAVEEELERLIQTLKWIKATMYDAEEREIIDRSVKFWLKELKKIAYDAEDVLSEYRYEVTRVQVEARKASQASGSQKRKQMEYIVPIPDGIVDRLNKIRSRFDEIAKDREALQLRENDGMRRPNNKILRPPTGHMVDEASIFGRDADISKVIDFLLTEKEKSFSVISIVGKGGLGKTTIAQLVYKDERVSQCFNLFGWVCVSEEFDVKRLIKATIESVSKKKYRSNELSPLQKKLSKTVKGKTVLLVLDDVWNENQSVWELFQVSFKEAKMVRILMTTRNEKVANIMQSTVYFNPSNLSEDWCWQLFQHYAFSGTSYTMPIHMVDMGKEITRKCDGLPLAVKSIASLLRHETDKEGWREILQSDLWESNSSNDIFPALQISYAHLPTHLKLCFLFCSMYPKYYTLVKTDLIELWIAHGYVESRSNRKIIEIGVEYYNELKDRSFLDDDKTTEFEPSDTGYCKLHDIIHDLARLNSENEHYSVEMNQSFDSQERTIWQEAYHLYVSGSMGYVNQIRQQNLKGLRTIFMDIRECNGDLENIYCTNCTKSSDQNLELTEHCQDCLEHNLTKFEVLRVLILKWNSLTKISHSISELKYLTYLSIYSDRLKILPSSIGLLYNLKSLDVFCYSLEYLPENIGDLANLLFLRIYSGANLKKIPKSFRSLTNLLQLIMDTHLRLEYVPHGLVNFPSIKTFYAFLDVRSIGWLKDLKDLEGRIIFLGLENFRNLEDAKYAKLRNKCKLEILELRWDSFRRFNQEVNSDLNIYLTPEACEDEIVGADAVHCSLLECLQPHPNLKKLLVGGYPSALVPPWMSDPFSLQSIKEIKLENCRYFESLPFGNLHTLKKLSVEDCSSIRVMQMEKLPSQLETLEISGCYYLKLITGLGHLDMLERLVISNCSSLKSLTMDRLQLVTELFGDFSHEMLHIGRHSISPPTIQIKSCKLLHVLPYGLITSGPCYVLVTGCGCPDFEIGHQPLASS